MLLGILLALGTSVAWAFGNVYVQRSSRLVGGVRAMVWSLVVGAVVAALAAALLDHRSSSITSQVLAWALVSGVSGLAAYAGLFYAFTYGQLSVTVPFTSGWSLVAALFGLVMFGERPRRLQLVGAAVVFAGVLLVAFSAGRAGAGTHPADGGDRAPAAPPGWPPAWMGAVLAALGFGVMVPAMNQTSPAIGAFGSTACAYVLILILGLPLARAFRLDLVWPGRVGLPAVAGAGLFETAGFVLLALAGGLAPVALVAPVASLASALTVLYALAFLRERPGRLALAGALLASVGVVLLAIR